MEQRQGGRGRGRGWVFKTVDDDANKVPSNQTWFPVNSPVDLPKPPLSVVNLGGGDGQSRGNGDEGPNVEDDRSSPQQVKGMIVKSMVRLPSELLMKSLQLEHEKEKQKIEVEGQIQRGVCDKSLDFVQETLKSSSTTSNIETGAGCFTDLTVEKRTLTGSAQSGNDNYKDKESKLKKVPPSYARPLPQQQRLTHERCVRQMVSDEWEDDSNSINSLERVQNYLLTNKAPRYFSNEQ